MLKVRLFEAKNLKPKDDPSQNTFTCTLILESSKEKQSIKISNQQVNETLSFQLSNNVSDELNVEILSEKGQILANGQIDVTDAFSGFQIKQWFDLEAKTDIDGTPKIHMEIETENAEEIELNQSSSKDTLTDSESVSVNQVLRNDSDSFSDFSENSCPQNVFFERQKEQNPEYEYYYVMEEESYDEDSQNASEHTFDKTEDEQISAFSSKGMNVGSLSRNNESTESFTDINSIKKKISRNQWNQSPHTIAPKVRKRKLSVNIPTPRENSSELPEQINSMQTHISSLQRISSKEIIEFNVVNDINEIEKLPQKNSDAKVTYDEEDFAELPEDEKDPNGKEPSDSKNTNNTKDVDNSNSEKSSNQSSDDTNNLPNQITKKLKENSDEENSCKPIIENNEKEEENENKSDEKKKITQFETIYDIDNEKDDEKVAKSGEKANMRPRRLSKIEEKINQNKPKIPNRRSKEFFVLDQPEIEKPHIFSSDSSDNDDKKKQKNVPIMSTESSDDGKIKRIKIVGRKPSPPMNSPLNEIAYEKEEEHSGFHKTKEKSNENNNISRKLKDNDNATNKTESNEKKSIVSNENDNKSNKSESNERKSNKGKYTDNNSNKEKENDNKSNKLKENENISNKEISLKTKDNKEIGNNELSQEKKEKEEKEIIPKKEEKDEKTENVEKEEKKAHIKEKKIKVLKAGIVMSDKRDNVLNALEETKLRAKIEKRKREAKEIKDQTTVVDQKMKSLNLNVEKETTLSHMKVLLNRNAALLQRAESELKRNKTLSEFSRKMVSGAKEETKSAIESLHK